ncbi:MAG TPA: tetratricopeptide repeat protein [Candidatus Brocadiaceae bacterium]|nr:tetratricopeptide repeat protein [Candidatus Brocadiaceae bacterium]
MKKHVSIFCGLFLITTALNCGKNDAASPGVGALYNSKILRNEVHKADASQKTPSETVDVQLIREKLKAMSNDELFQFALSCGNQGRYADAMAIYNRILEKDKNYPEIYYYQGLLYRDMGLRDESICAFQTAIAQNPNSVEAHYNLGYAYRCKGLHREAIDEYRKALELVSESKIKQKASIHYSLGYSYFSSGMIDDAITEFNQALAYKPNDKEIHQKLGIAYTAKGWGDKAKNEFTLYHQDDMPVRKTP